MRIGLRQIGVYSSILILSGCGVNRAVIDPWSYAPDDPYCFWLPDSKAGVLACEKECLPEVPSKDQILSLAEVLDIALINNPQTQVTWAEARVAAAQYAGTQSALLPNITGTYSYMSSRQAFLSSIVTLTSGSTSSSASSTPLNALFAITQDQWGPQLALTYNILDFGQRRATSEAARYSLYFANYTHNREVQTILETVTQDFYNLLYQWKLLQAYEMDVATAQETYDSASLALSTGVQDISDVLQAKTQLLQVQIQLISQKQNIVNALTTLLNDMGLPANYDISLQQMPTEYPEKIDLLPLNDWIETAKENRPDLLAARASVHSAEQSLKAANRAWMPNVNYALNFGTTTFSGNFNDKYDYTSTISVSMPIFAGFSYRNAIRQAEAAEEQAEATLKQVELAALQQVTAAYSDVSVSLDTLKSANILLKATEEQYEVAIAQYRAGTGNILEVASAQSALFDARARVVSSMKGWLTSLATLSYQTGTLSKPPSYEKIDPNS